MLRTVELYILHAAVPAAGDLLIQLEVLVQKPYKHLPLPTHLLRPLLILIHPPLLVLQQHLIPLSTHNYLRQLLTLIINHLVAEILLRLKILYDVSPQLLGGFKVVALFQAGED